MIRRSSPLVSNLRLMAIGLAGAALLVTAPAGAAQLLCGDLAGFGGSSPSNPGGSLRPGRDCVEQFMPPEGGVLIGEAISDPGIVRSSATVALPAGVSHLVQSSAGWEETAWVVNHPDTALQGSFGLLRFEFFLEGFLDATGAGQSSVALVVEGNRTPRTTLFSSVATGVTGSRPVAAFVEGTITFRFGETSNFFFNLITRAERAPLQAGAGFAEALFSNTGYWGGILAIEDGNGPLEGFTFSGNNVTFGERLTPSQVPAAVPLPASAWLLGTGIAGLLWRRRAKAAAA